ncbi:ABC transporter permease [Roseovarius sp.]|uniref:ABC transporter permease n=1 Tax=Roseovarius sp. TaxID=1486281 RepID=UPI000C5FF0BB|nr:ABC transporter permease [Roseovarius sp.]MAZ21041.1 ABC transporter permease [Roseovarius sp.]
MGGLSALIAKRIGLGLLSLIAVSLIIFFAVELLPGDLAEAILGQNATPETLEAMRRDLGLDRSAPVRYVEWIGNVVTGDLGESLASGRDVSELIGARFGATLFLAAYAALISVPLALFLGMATALFRNTRFDRVTNAGALFAISFPEFFIGYLLIYLLAQNGLFPSMSRITEDMDLGQRLHSTFLPALTLTFVVTGYMMRMTRAAILNVLSAPYIEMARLKGLRPRNIITRHALPNAASPIVNVISLSLAYLITGVVMVEVVFVYPGVGQLLVDSVVRRDLPVIQGVSLMFASVYILLNLSADVISMLSNPRLLHGR